MSIKSICQTDVVTAHKSTTLKDISAIMQQKHVGSIVICEGHNGEQIPCGIITDRDLAMALGASQRPQELRVDQIMQSHPVTASIDEGIFEITLKMRETGVKRLPVVNHDGSLFGVISADDLLSLMGEEINNLSKITEVQVSNEKGIRLPKEKQGHIEM